jgi:hypothetical protein
MPIGEYIQERRGKVCALRVLDYGKLEAAFQAPVRLLGIEVTELYTRAISQKPGGALYMEGNRIITSCTGDSEF